VWPFVTAYMMRAATRAANADVATLDARSLVRGGAIYSRNKENLNILTGGTSTVVNNDRQLWSVAGMMSMVQQSIFGIEARDDGLYVKPFIPARLAAEYFPGNRTVALQNVDYRGHNLDVQLNLPSATAGGGGYQVASMALDGMQIPADGAITEDMLGADSRLVVTLGQPSRGPGPSAPALRTTSSVEGLYGPTTPAVEAVTATGDQLRLAVDIGSEDPSRVVMDVMRDGDVVARDLPVTSTSPVWVDRRVPNLDRVSPCYSVRLTYRSSGNTGQHAKPAGSRKCPARPCAPRQPARSQAP